MGVKFMIPEQHDDNSSDEDLEQDYQFNENLYENVKETIEDRISEENKKDEDVVTEIVYEEIVDEVPLVVESARLRDQNIQIEKTKEKSPSREIEPNASSIPNKIDEAIKNTSNRILEIKKEDVPITSLSTIPPQPPAKKPLAKRNPSHNPFLTPNQPYNSVPTTPPTAITDNAPESINQNLGIQPHTDQKHNEEAQGVDIEVESEEVTMEESKQGDKGLDEDGEGSKRQIGRDTLEGQKEQAFIGDKE